MLKIKITGPSGSGKTSVKKIIVQALNEYVEKHSELPSWDILIIEELSSFSPASAKELLEGTIIDNNRSEEK